MHVKRSKYNRLPRRYAPRNDAAFSSLQTRLLRHCEPQAKQSIANQNEILIENLPSLQYIIKYEL